MFIKHRQNQIHRKGAAPYFLFKSCLSILTKIKTAMIHESNNRRIYLWYDRKLPKQENAAIEMWPRHSHNCYGNAN